MSSNHLRVVVVALLGCTVVPDDEALAMQSLQMADKYGDPEQVEERIKHVAKFLQMYKTDDGLRNGVLMRFGQDLFDAGRFNQSIALDKKLLRSKFSEERYVVLLLRILTAIHISKRAGEPATQEFFEQYVERYRFKGKKHIFWSSVYQFSPISKPNLEARPWWPSDTPGAIALKKGYAKIRREGLALLAKGMMKPRNVAGDKKLVLTGDWLDFNLKRTDDDKLDEKACLAAPDTCAVIMGDPHLNAGPSAGSVGFLVLTAGTRLQVHVGETNTRLYMQLALKVPKGTAAEIGFRVGDEREDGVTRQFEEGEVMLFDDTFVHEVWNYAKEPRVIFQIAQPHPDLQRLEL